MSHRQQRTSDAAAVRERTLGRADVWPHHGGEAVLFDEALALLAGGTVYRLNPAGQPPPPNIQRSR